MPLQVSSQYQQPDWLASAQNKQHKRLLPKPAWKATQYQQHDRSLSSYQQHKGHVHSINSMAGVHTAYNYHMFPQSVNWITWDYTKQQHFTCINYIKNDRCHHGINTMTCAFARSTALHLTTLINTISRGSHDTNRTVVDFAESVHLQTTTTLQQLDRHLHLSTTLEAFTRN